MKLYLHILIVLLPFLFLSSFSERIHFNVDTSRADYKTITNFADTIPPTVTNVTSSTNDGIYKIGDAIDITITFSENVILSGGGNKMKLYLETGGVDQQLDIVSFGPAISTSLTYTVQAGDESGDLNAISPIKPLGSSLKDTAGNDAILTIPNGVNIADSKDIVVDGILPTVSNHTPPDEATGVANATNLSILFSEAVNADTGSIELRKTSNDALIESFDVTSDISGSGTNTITFDPAADLEDVTGYYVIVPATAFDDIAGNDFAGLTLTTDWNFTSSNAAFPTVTLLTPTDNATGVNVTTDLVILFSETIYTDNGSIGLYTSVDDALVQSFDVTTDIIGSGSNTITINPASDLAIGKSYYVLIPATAFRDFDINYFPGYSVKTDWNFITADGVAPTVSSFYPADGATGVGLSDSLVITFTEPVDVETGTITIRRTSDDSDFEIFTLPDVQVTGTGTAAITITPSAAFAENTDYYVLIDATAFDDPAGNSFAGISNKTTWNFITEQTTATPPVFASTYPKTGTITATTADIPVQINENGTAYLVTLPDGAIAPSSNQVKAGTDASNNTVATGFADTVTLTANTEDTLVTVNLAPETGYDIYIVAEDDSGALQTSPVKIDTTTGSTTAPVIISLSSTKPNGRYGIGDTIPIVIAFSEPVTLAGGNLLVTLETGDTNRIVSIAPFGPSDSITGLYIIQEADSTSLLKGISPLTLSGGTLQDGQSNNALLTIPSNGNISDYKSIAIDGMRPTILVTNLTQDTIIPIPALSYTLSEAIITGSFTWTRSSGTVDPNSPHITTLSGDDLTAGSHSISGLLSGEKLVHGAVYLLSSTALDLAGNQSSANILSGITYSPTITFIEIIPDTITINADTTARFTVQALDTDSNEFVVYTVIWQVISDSGRAGPIGTIDSTGTFYPASAGTGKIVASYELITDTSGTITVITGAVSTLQLSPDSVQLEVDDSISFTIQGYDKNNNTVSLTNSSVTWQTVTEVGDTIGKISSIGVFTATGVGTGFVVCTYDSLIADTSFVNSTGWSDQIPVNGNTTIQLGNNIILIIPQISGLSGGTISAFPYTGTNFPPGVIIVERPIQFDTTGIASFDSAITVKLTMDTLQLKNDGHNPEDVRVYYCFPGKETEWYVVHTSTTNGDTISFPATDLYIFVLGIDTITPSIEDLTPRGHFVERTPLDVTFAVHDNIMNPLITLNYRVGGEQTYTKISFETTDSLDTVTIQGDLVTERGLTFYLDASDALNSKQTSGHDASISIARYAMADTFSNGYYQMISIPLGYNNNDGTDLYIDDIGAFDKKQWRMYSLTGNSFIEITTGTALSVSSGHALWLRTKSAVVIDIDSALSLPISKPYEITLVPGWNSIATPFPFPVDWDEIKQATGTVADSIMGIYAYNHIEKIWSDPTETKEMETWKGYLVKNLTQANAVLKIPSYEYSSRKHAAVRMPDSAVKISMDITGSVKKEKKRIISGFNFRNASDNYDKNDFLQPPSFETKLQAFFLKTGWGVFSGKYMTDFRGELNEGKSWEFTVKSPYGGNTITMDFKGLAKLPKGIEAHLVDMKKSAAFDLRDSTFTYFHGKESEREFRLLIGSEDFITQETKYLKGIPKYFSLQQNYPNPFRGYTIIRYAIPLIDNGAKSHIKVSLKIYDLKGRCIVTLLNDKMEPGYYTIRWNGCTKSGMRVAQGTYIYRFVAGKKFRKVKKIIKLQ